VALGYFLPSPSATGIVLRPECFSDCCTLSLFLISVYPRKSAAKSFPLV